MDLLSKLKPKLQGHAPAAGAPARPGSAGGLSSTRIRRRLVGSAMLLLLGVIVLPLLFEGQPRPSLGVAQVQPLPERDAAGGLALPTAARTVGKEPEESPVPPVEPSASGVLLAQAPVQHRPPSALSAPSATSAASVPAHRTELRGSAASGVLLPLALPGGVAVSASAVPPALPGSVSRPASQPRVTSPDVPERQPPAQERYIVQVGTYSEDAEVRSVRMQVEKLGLKTYVQMAGSASAPKVRVRLGPFSSKAEADRAANRVKAAGLSGSVLAL